MYLQVVTFQYCIPGSLEESSCDDISGKYYIASCMLCNTFKVKCPVSGANSLFSFIRNSMSGNDLLVLEYTTAVWK